MSRLKISPNLFLEVNELNRNNLFLVDKGYKRIIQSMIQSFGIVKNESNSNFKVTLKENTSNVIVINTGVAITKEIECAVLEEPKEVTLTDNGSKKWILLSRAVTNQELGTVSITSNGTLTGLNTEFSKVLRGQPNFPTKIKLDSEYNTEEYEVLSVTADNSAVLSGTFYPESGLKYSVIGTFTPGYQVPELDKYIYEYDSVNIRIVDSESEPVLNENEYIIAAVTFSGGFAVIEDLRNDYLFNEEDYTFQRNSYSEKTNNVISLLDVKRIDENVLEFVVESGYKINTYEFISTSENNIIRILSATNNYLNYSQILLNPTNDMFNGYVLLNRKNMKSSIIDTNLGADLYVSNLEIGLLEESGNDLVIIPNFYDFELELSFSGADTRENIYKKFSSSNIKNRFQVPIKHGESLITLKYRLLEGIEKSSKFHNLNIAEFNNMSGNLELLGNSNLTVNVTQVVEIRNYS